MSDPLDHDNDGTGHCKICGVDLGRHCDECAADAERARIVAIIERRRAAYESQDDGHGALLQMGFSYLLSEIKGTDNA